VCYPRPHLSVRFEAKRVLRLEILISNIACLAFRLVAAGRHCQSPLFGSQQQTSSATISTLVVPSPPLFAQPELRRTNSSLAMLLQCCCRGRGKSLFALGHSPEFPPSPATPSPRKHTYPHTGRDHSPVEIYPSKSLGLSNYKAFALIDRVAVGSGNKTRYVELHNRA